MSGQHSSSGLEIAVVGMAGRFPGAATVDELWQQLLDGVECISTLPEERLRAAGVSAERLADRNYVKAAGLLDGVELFDAAFFGYSPRDAALLDPQQRFFLETAWTALEHAGHAPGTIDVPVGVYGGIGLNEYYLAQVRPSAVAAPDDLIHIANDRDFLATRVSYKLNLEGPSLTVQTACSTSLVAIHLACQALLAGECDLALAGGVTLRLAQSNGYLFQEGGITSPDGHCRAFSARAEGCVPGSGGAVVVLKRLADALADRDCIHAVVKGSAINNDGAVKVGYTAPAVEGQTRAIRSALRAADVSADSIGYLEAHGTGTALGDPIEIQAATRAYRHDTDRKAYCGLGSIKTNVGHLDAGAGVAGFIKAALAVKHGVLPPSLHCEATNPAIDFANSPFVVNTRRQPWTADGLPRRAGVSSFGIGGTNAHIILEEPPSLPKTQRQAATELLILSAKSAAALDNASAQLAAYLSAHPDADLSDAAFTLRCGRTPMAHRRAIVCRSTADACDRLMEPAGSRPAVGSRQHPPTVVYMFPGQGSQHWTMGRALYDAWPVFRSHFDRAAEILRPRLGVDITDIVYRTAEDEAQALLRETSIAQPAIFAAAYAAAQLLASWGLRPAAMIGHSIGEYVAATLANVFSLEDALRLVSERGRLMGALPRGSMVAVNLDAAALASLLPSTLAVAAVNAPGLSVVSGPAVDADAFVAELEARGIQARPLVTSHAFHSAAMDPVLDAFVSCFATVRAQAPAIPYVSNVTGTWIAPEQAVDPGYWAEHLRRTVRFSEGLQTILATPNTVLVDVGPGQTLTALAKRHVANGSSTPAILSMMPRAGSAADDAVALDALAGLWTAGVDIDWRRVSTAADPRRIPLPTYPFQRERFWLDAAAASETVSPAARRDDLATWFSTQSWERLPDRASTGALASRSDAATTRWIVFADEYGLGDSIAAQLRDRGGDVVMVNSGNDFAQLSNRRYRIDAGAPRHYLELLSAFASADRSPLRIVHCWTSEPDDCVRRGRSNVLALQERGFYSVLLLAQALGAQAWLDSCHIAVVSSNVHDVVGSETLCPEKATILGPVKVIPLEYDRITCSHLDVVVPGTSSEMQALAAAAIASIDKPESDSIAIRGPHRWRPTLIPVTLNRAENSLRLREQGVYLITGGLGGVGLALAEHLAKSVRARLVLVGRQAPPPRHEWPRWLRGESIDASSAFDRLRRSEQSIVQRVPLNPMSRMAGLDRMLDRLCVAYVQRFFAASGIDVSVPQTIDRDGFTAACKVQPRFARLFNRMLRVLEDDGSLERRGATLHVTGRAERLDAESISREACLQYPAMTPLFELLSNSAGQLKGALSGEIPAIGLLFGDEHIAIFKRAVETIRDHSYVPLCQRLVRELVVALSAESRTRPLRILEIGGGEGLLTSALLPALEGRAVEYTFTDISRSFVVNAERRLASPPTTNMRFGVLDISKPPAQQGFMAGGYDVIVAFNVLHATSRVDEALGHARDLLAPGGVLILQESVRSAAWIDLIWGLTDGWWAFEDAPLRTASPLLGLDEWGQALRGGGFEQVAAYPGIAEIRAEADTGVIFARKPTAIDQTDAAPPSLTDDRSLATAARVAALSRLEQLGAEVEIVQADVADSEAMRQAVASAVSRFGRINGVVHAALVLNDGAIQTKTRASVEGVLAPKVDGTLVLKEVCQDLDLDFLAICSSLVSVLGGEGQVDYCAASNFQDAFARAESGRLARSVVSIDWAAWRDVGKAFRAAVERGAEPADALPDGMAPAEGVEAFVRALDAGLPHVIVSPQHPASLVANRRRPTLVRPAAPAGSVPPATSDVDNAVPQTDTEKVIAGIWQRILGVPQLGVRDNFFDLGGDSMISLQFIAEAKKAGLRFTNRQVFEHQTIAALAATVGGKD